MKRKLVSVLVATWLISTLTGCGQDVDNNSGSDNTQVESGTAATPNQTIEGMTNILLSDDGILVDGEAISEDENADIYAANDIVFYLADQGFTYGEGEEADEHTQEEADEHTVVHITKPGEYAVTGQLSAGQIAIDLGEEAEDDPEAVVTLYLNGVDIQCDVAPAVIFYNVYECGSTDEDAASKDVDTSAAGANVVIVDDTVNNVAGSYVARIYKEYTLNEAGTEVVDNKKLHKYDAAFYSKMSMNVNGGEAGTGILNIDAENEGLDSELHLTINGGTINIFSGNDGINTNEDGISVTTVNGGNLHITVTGTTGEGDGIDSNGWLVINGGAVTASACGDSADAGIDSDMGIYINGGTILASGNMMDRIEGDGQSYVTFVSRTRLQGDVTYAVKDGEGNVVCEYTPANDFTYLIVSNAEIGENSYTLWNGEEQVAGSSSMQGGMGGPGMGGFGGNRGEMPEGMERPEGMEIPEGMEMPEGMERPEMPDGTPTPESGSNHA